MEVMFSIIVPIYKVEPFLRKCVDSILCQTFTDFELLLIDDGSPDNCPRICDEYAQADGRVRVIHKANGGLVSARNRGVKEAKGTYICYVDGDDWVSERLLQTVMDEAILPHHPDMAVFGARRVFSDHTVDIPSGAEQGIYDKQRLEKEVYPYMMYDNRKPFCSGLIFPVAWNKIYKRELLQAHYCEDERIKMGEDNAFIFECLYYSNCVYFCDECLYFYNQLNEGSFIHSYDSKRFDNNQLLNDYIEKRLGGKNKTLDLQINAFKAYWLIMAVFHEMKSGRKLGEARKHVSRKIKETKVLHGISMNGLPKFAKAYLMLLKCHLYGVSLIGAKIVSRYRG